MLSVILYGRNDSYGYNLHKRAAISLNCIAEMLSGEHDEIIFVDYNTPNDLPTFIEAIYDTLTPRARWVLRVLRVRPEVHHRLYGTRTHLAALEAICRNIGVRRSNPQNRWILSTNTDMIFVPRNREYDLTSTVSDLADGHYILPRFELPEPFWESFPRTDPAAIIRACNQLGAALHLNEVTLAHPYMRFDNPGDAQFLPRQTLFDIFGFDERLIHGWHVDSNMCKRLFHLYGVTGSLADRLKGYHCDHTRERTLAHRLDFRIESDPHEFVYNIDNPYASHQSHSWGLPEDAIEEIDFGNGPPARFVPVVQRTLGVPQDRDYHSDSNELRNYLFYHPEHVLPYVAANLTVYPRDVRLLYIGNNPRLLTLLATCFRDLGFSRPLGWVPDLMCSPLPELADGVAAAIEYGPEDPSFSRSLITNHDVLIFDFGLDAARLPSSNVAPGHGLATGPALSPGRNRSMFGILRRGMSHGISIDAKLVSAGLPRGQSQPSSLRSIRVAVSAHHQDTLQHPRAQRTRAGWRRALVSVAPLEAHRGDDAILLRVRPPGRVGPTARSRRLD